MRDFLDQQAAARSEFHARFSCDHPILETRRRVIRGGSIQYVQQCVRCGEPQGSAIAKAKALAECGGEPAAFDDDLSKQWQAAYAEAYQALRARFDRDAFLSHYSDYLASDAWRNRRALVLKRARNVCEGCGVQPATQVHHLSYKHVCNEFLFELVAVCDECHDRIHEDEKGDA